MSSYKHFTLEERKYLQDLLSQGYSFRKIAAYLGRSPSTISREVNRNKAKWPTHKKSNNKYRYNAWHSQNLYWERRRRQDRRTYQPGMPEWDFIVEKLSKYWSPEQICAVWNKEHPGCKKLHYSTIYRYIKEKRLLPISAKTHLRRRGKHIMPRSSNYNTIHPDRIIPEWPEEIKNRLRIGDWEGDTVYGGVGKGLLVTLVDRKSRFLCAALLEKRDSKLTRQCIVQQLLNLPVRSINLDNGSEFAEFRELERNLNTQVYFAEPHKPWQRGTNENTNDILRFFFPKGFDFHKITQQDVDEVVALINTRPRKCLGYRSPAEVFGEYCVALD